jgi:hypothetical protein
MNSLTKNLNNTLLQIISLNKKNAFFYIRRNNFCQKLNDLSYSKRPKFNSLNKRLNQLEEIFKIQNEKKIRTSLIRSIDIGQNYFRFISPKRKKMIYTLLNSYLRVLTDRDANSSTNFKIAMDLFYNGHLNGKSLENISIRDSDLDLSSEIIWHLHILIVFDRLATQYCRYEFMDYHQIIKELNAIPKKDRNRSKYVFTSHPTQPNSMDQILSLQELIKAVEENDMDYLYESMSNLVEAFHYRKTFSKPSYLEESLVYHRMSIPNLINSLSMAYELGLEDLEDFYEIPGTWITFDFDNHPEMKVGIMTYTHAHTISVTINCYMKIILEACILEIPEIIELFNIFEKILNYCNKIQELSDFILDGKINKNEFFRDLPIFNLRSYERKTIQILEKLVNNEKKYSNKVLQTSKKVYALMKVFKLSGCLGQIRLAGEELYEKNNLKDIIHDIFKEISILNNNGNAADMLIIANYTSSTQYNLVKELLEKYNVLGIEIVPLLETFSSSNDTDSKITMIASSDTRQRDGLLLTELRTLREDHNNPNKYIYMGQGITAERGGGPFSLLHQKYCSLTYSQRKRHIRTVQGFFFTSEYISKDLTFNVLLKGAKSLNHGDNFKPTLEYMDFLFELDNIIGVPQREMQKTNEYNDLYVKNPIIKTCVDSFNFAGSRDMGKELLSVKKTRAIIQAYINSDRLSYCHPELAYWDKVGHFHQRKITQNYYENNQHFIYLLYNYAFMIRRYDLDFAAENALLDKNNKYFQIYKNGYNSLKQLLTSLGLGFDSFPIGQIYSEHLGLSNDSSYDEIHQKERLFKYMYKLQNYQALKYLENKNSIAGNENEYKLKQLQSALANISTSNGKG